MSRQEIIEYLGADWDRVLALIRDRLHSDVDLLKDTNDRILSNSGKQLRPMITLLIARAIAAPNGDSICCAAASELLHNATLIHDDVADESAERRGRPTLSALLGPGPAVLVGDYWLARAVGLIVDTEHRDPMIRAFAKTLTDLAEGEMLQLEKASSCDTQEADYLRSAPIHPSQKETEKGVDYSIFTLHLGTNAWEFYQEILSHGNRLEILAPASLRKDIAARIEEMRERYAEFWQS